LTYLVGFALRLLWLDVDPARNAFLAVDKVIALNVFAKPEGYQERPGLLEGYVRIRPSAQNAFE
jgi:hypothetical protein